MGIHSNFKQEEKPGCLQCHEGIHALDGFQMIEQEVEGDGRGTDVG